MILILAGGGNEAKQFAKALESEKIAHLCVFSSFLEAGNYGRGNTIIGRLDRRAVEGVLHSESVHGVVDLVAYGDRSLSKAAMAACRECKIPYVKRLHMPKSHIEYVRAFFTPSYAEAAKKISQRIGNILLYTAPETARALAARVHETENLYTPILRGVSFDVELAMEYGIPLMNVMELELLEGVDAVCAAAERIGATMLVCDGSCGIDDKLAAAKKLKLPIVITHNMGLEYTMTAQSDAAAMELVRQWIQKKNAEGENGNAKNCN